MKNLFSMIVLVATGFLGACSTTNELSHAPALAAKSTQISHPIAASNETLLLVSLEDGSVIMQTISAEADICFKQVTASSTTCFDQGAAIVDPVTQAIIGFEMTESRIDLVAAPRY